MDVSMHDKDGLDLWSGLVFWIVLGGSDTPDPTREAGAREAAA